MSRPDLLIVVKGRNRRAYAKVCKKTATMERYVQRHIEKESEKSAEEGFKCVGVEFSAQHGNTYEFHLKYEPICPAKWSAK